MNRCRTICQSLGVAGGLTKLEMALRGIVGFQRPVATLGISLMSFLATFAASGASGLNQKNLGSNSLRPGQCKGAVTSLSKAEGLPVEVHLIPLGETPNPSTPGPAASYRIQIWESSKSSKEPTRNYNNGVCRLEENRSYRCDISGKDKGSTRLLISPTGQDRNSYSLKWLILDPPSPDGRSNVTKTLDWGTKFDCDLADTFTAPIETQQKDPRVDSGSHPKGLSVPAPTEDEDGPAAGALRQLREIKRQLDERHGRTRQDAAPVYQSTEEEKPLPRARKREKYQYDEEGNILWNGGSSEGHLQ